MFVHHVLFFLMNTKQMTRAAGEEIDLRFVCVVADERTFQISVCVVAMAKQACFIFAR